jgi:hypothetical protein
MGNKAGTRRTITEEEVEIEHTNGTEAVTAIKAFVLEGAPYPAEVLVGYEFNLKANALDRTGATKKGFYTTTDDLEHFVEKIVDDRGPGRYNIWVQFRKIDSDKDKWNVIVFKDQRIYDPEEDYTRLETEEINPPERQQPATDQTSLVYQIMQANQQQMTALLTSLIGKMGAGSGDGSVKALLEGLNKGIELAQGNQGSVEDDDPEDNPPEESIMEKLAIQAIPLLEKLLSNKDPNVGINRETVLQLAAEHLTPDELQQLAQGKHENIHQLPPSSGGKAS